MSRGVIPGAPSAASPGPTRAVSRRDAVLALGAIVLMAACGREGAAPAPGPVAVGQDECDYCRMVVDDAKLVAQLVPERGRPLIFGEVGCLLAWLDRTPASAGTPFVTASDTGAWLPAAQAHYSIGLSRTPMRFDILAHAAPAPGSATATTWGALRAEGAPHARQS